MRYYGKITDPKDLVTKEYSDSFPNLEAGTGIEIVTDSEGKKVINNTQTSSEWGNITGTLENQTDLQAALDDKQDIIEGMSYVSLDLLQPKLTAGTKITINDDSEGNQVIDTTASSVSVSSSGTSTTEAKYLTVDGTEYKIGGGIQYEEVTNEETWLINNVPTLLSTGQQIDYRVNFLSDGENFDTFTLTSWSIDYSYTIEEESYVTTAYDTDEGWYYEACKTVVFADKTTIPAGLATWLQANAVKQ